MSQECSGEAYNVPKIKIYWNFDIFADLESLEFEPLETLHLINRRQVLCLFNSVLARQLQ
jgi:hypothetical protein